MDMKLVNAILDRMPTYCAGLNPLALMRFPETIEDPPLDPNRPMITVRINTHGLKLYEGSTDHKPFPDIGF